MNYCGKNSADLFLTGITNTFEEIIKSGLKNIDLTKKLSFWESHAKKKIIIKTDDRTLSLKFALF